MQCMATLYQTVAIVNSEYIFLVQPTAVGSGATMCPYSPMGVWAVAAGSDISKAL